MIETKFVKNIVKEFQIGEFILENLKNVGFSKAELHKTPLGEKIVIHASRPGLIVGRKGENIQKLTKTLKVKFKLENPQIEIIEVEDPMLNAQIVGDRIASSLERFGLSKFKGIAHKSLTDVVDAGAKGVEIVISGKIPSSRAKRWRFFQGYLKKSGDIAVSGIRKAYVQAKLKTGVVGIQVRIMPPDLTLPDTVVPLEEVVTIKNAKPKAEEADKDAKEKVEEKAPAKEEKKAEAKEEVAEKTEEKKTEKKATKKKATKKKVTKKKTTKKADDVKEEAKTIEETKVEEKTKEKVEEAETKESKTEEEPAKAADESKEK